MKLKDRAILFHEYDSKGGRDVDDGKGDGSGFGSGFGSGSGSGFGSSSGSGFGSGSGSGSGVGESGNGIKTNLKKSNSTILNMGITSSN